MIKLCGEAFLKSHTIAVLLPNKNHLKTWMPNPMHPEVAVVQTPIQTAPMLRWPLQRPKSP